jgi:hypothetical protein
LTIETGGTGMKVRLMCWNDLRWRSPSTMAVGLSLRRATPRRAMRFHATDASGVRRVELHPLRAGASTTIEVRAPLPYPRASPSALARTQLPALTNRPRARCARTGSRSDGGRHWRRHWRRRIDQPSRLAAGSRGGRSLLLRLQRRRCPCQGCRRVMRLRPPP